MATATVSETVLKRDLAHIRSRPVDEKVSRRWRPPRPGRQIRRHAGRVPRQAGQRRTGPLRPAGAPAGHDRRL